MVSYVPSGDPINGHQKWHVRAIVITHYVPILLPNAVLCMSKTNHIA